ncbi:MAG: hypothetical protein KGL39_15750 [Patescibacteria group bacterium]|nr:hypothetical protein [Patescibacteria group bacterium]
MSEPIFEPTPRWADGPRICTYENLPAFATEADLNDFKAASCPAATLIEKWMCRRCYCWHFIAAPPVPAGATTGCAREYVAPVPRYKREAHE